MHNNLWTPRGTTQSEQFLADYAERLEISPLLVLLLGNRGMSKLEDMELFLNPGLRHLASLEDWPGLDEAATLLCKAVLEGETIGIWGDYDVDGITSTALLIDFFTQHSVQCLHHIPNRLEEGYGLNREHILLLAQQGVTTFITVDSGISDVDAITYAKELGLKVVITDHHLPGEILPPADAIVNPRLAACPCPALAGVGVAFFLAAALNAKLAAISRPKIDVRTLLDLVALGTLADVVNVSGQNRILIKNGLLSLSEGHRPGIAALKSVCNFAPAAALDAGQVVFSLAPRINAAGRMGSSDIALELLLCNDFVRAEQLAQELALLNTSRREEEDTIFQSALAQAEVEAGKGRTGLVLHDESWHPGIIGIVASRIAEKFHCPTVVLTSTQGFCKGSGRSFGNFHLHEAFVSASDLLLGYGGHRMAAGLSLAPDNLEPFRQRFDALVKNALGQEPPQGQCSIDAVLSFAVASRFTILKELELLQPFGSGNAEPVFASPPVRVKNILSRPGFCSLDLVDEQSGITLRAKAWRDLANFPANLKGQRIRIAYSPRIDRYNGAANVELRIKDWKPATELVPNLPVAPEMG